MSPTPRSLPKDQIKLQVGVGLSQSAVELLAAAGSRSVNRESKALDGAVLARALKGVHVLGIRSRTQVTEEVLAAADRLITIG
ncbi:MAG: phosphoglycerate dehydrogenase, partial [bacterium]